MNNYSLVIIGGGSAGLASAISSYDNGVKDILIIEKEAYLGGILLQCIHNGFGLHTFKEELTGPEYAQRYVEEIKKRNIKYLLNTTALKIDNTNGLKVHYSNSSDGYTVVNTKAIICATGCMERTRGAINIPGDRPSGVITAGLAQKYLNIDGYMVGKKVFILGSGDIGLIMARRMVLEGAEVLGVAELMPYSNGLMRNIVQCLNDYNIPLYLHHTIKEIIGKTRLEKIIVSEVDGNLNFIEGTEKSFDVDTLLLSVGLIPSNPLLTSIGVKTHPKTKGPLVNENLETSIEGIFSCGNSLHVHDLVDFVSNEGTLAGLCASKYIKGELKRGKSVNLINGNKIGYVLPQEVSLGEKNPFEIKFRVITPLKDVELIVRQNDKIIKSIKKQYLVPSEMEKIKIDTSNITSDDDITIEVK